jgi:putative FmdB family regulatory protein
MPIYERVCPKCGESHEFILKINERNKEIVCKTCNILMHKLVSLPAKTATLWNDGWNAGLSGQGVFSHALGKKVHSKREESTILESKGFVSERDLAPHWWEDQQAKKIERLKEQDKLTETYNGKVAEYGGDKIRAMTETFTTEKCLDGTLHKTFDDKISI